MGDAGESGSCSQRDEEHGAVCGGAASAVAGFSPATPKRTQVETSGARGTACSVAKNLLTTVEEHPILTALLLQALAWGSLFLWT